MVHPMSDETYMEMAFEEASMAASREEVPVGALLVSADGKVLAREGNRILEKKDPTAHAEILAIRAAAARLGNERLIGTTLYVTLEPCTMCAGAISFARVARLVYGAPDEKGGAVDHGAEFFKGPTCHHRPEVDAGLMAEESAELLRGFFRARRKS